MSKKILFSYELKPGMIAAEDILDSNGTLIIPAGQAFDNDTIDKLHSFSIPDVPIEDAPKGTGNVIPDYAGKVKASPEYKVFSAEYENEIALVKRNLDGLAADGRPVDSQALIDAVFNLTKNCKTIIQVFDILSNLAPSDEPVYHHSINVAIIAVMLGRWLDMPQEELNQLALSGILHDVGKLNIPPATLNKTGKLTDEELTTVHNHVKYGYNILKDQQQLDPRIKDAALYHHERCDRSGYPFRMAPERIPEFAKLIAIADVYDAMTSTRTYRKSFCPFEVIQIFDSEGLGKYDPQYIMTFLENIVLSYMNNDVLLSDGRIGEIVMINKGCLYKPIVKIGEEFVDLYFTNDLRIEQII